MCTTVYYSFQFEVSIRKAAEHLVRPPPKTLPKPQLQPEAQHPFSVVRLRHVDQTHAETKPEPQPESADPPAPSPSCQSAIHFMSRVLQRLREVDEHVSEVISIFSFTSLTSVFPPCLLFKTTDCCMLRSPKRPQSEGWLYIMPWLYI